MLNLGIQVLSGTPRKVFDMIQRKAFRTRNLKMFIIDETEQILSVNFKDKIYNIFRYCLKYRNYSY